MTAAKVLLIARSVNGEECLRVVKKVTVKKVTGDLTVKRLKTNVASATIDHGASFFDRR